ncbi:unnamed protein product [Plutella xylostella]|uniref:(diamondback moth) hypothetical protein n=1 Tax=Plutella xylostella TaxID=51655 RepID=A0A8S4EKI3_PLUXY|nr:unnamed protein product [Plutella xylostella]
MRRANCFLPWNPINTASVESHHAPSGGAVELPCDVTPTLADDRMGLVIWYKQGHTTPIYTTSRKPLKPMANSSDICIRLFTDGFNTRKIHDCLTV